MAPKRGGSKQQQLKVDQFTLLKKPMEHLGKQINLTGFWVTRHKKSNALLYQVSGPFHGLFHGSFTVIYGVARGTSAKYSFQPEPHTSG